MKQLTYPDTYTVRMRTGQVYRDVVPVRELESGLFGTCLLAMFRRPDTGLLDDGLFRKDLIASMQMDFPTATTDRRQEERGHDAVNRSTSATDGATTQPPPRAVGGSQSTSRVASESKARTEVG